MGKEIRWMDAYKGKREQGNLGRQGEKKSSPILRQTKRENSLKETSHSTWEDLCFLEEDSMDKVGWVSFGMILRKNQNL
jgi:hypothetical protein